MVCIVVAYSYSCTPGNSHQIKCSFHPLKTYCIIVGLVLFWGLGHVIAVAYFKITACSDISNVKVFVGYIFVLALSVTKKLDATILFLLYGSLQCY